jgi:hypothetical protein
MTDSKNYFNILKTATREKVGGKRGRGESTERLESLLYPQEEESMVRAFSHLWFCKVPGLYLKQKKIK